MLHRRQLARSARALGIAAAIAGLTHPAHAKAPAGEPGAEVLRYQYSRYAESAVQKGGPGADGALSITMRDAVVVVPVAGLGSPSLWVTGGFGRDFSLGFTRFAASTAGVVPELNNRGLLLGTTRRLDSGQEFLGVLASGYFTTGDDYDVPLSTGGFALWRFPLSGDSRWGVGASATSELGTPGLIPLLEYRAWRPTWTADARLPLDADVRWWPLERLSLGGVWQVRGGQYTAADGRLAYDTIRFTAGTLSAVLGIGARGGPQLELTVGRTLFRRYQALKDEHTVLALEFAPGTAVTAKAAWRY